MKDQTKKKLIYIRYILPPILIFLLAVIAFIPAYRYAESGAAREPISLAALIANSFDYGRTVLFATANPTVGETAFSKILLTLAIVFICLYLVALVVAIWSCAVALKLFMSDDEEGAERSRTLFITFFQNRIVLTAAEALVLPLMTFAYLMPAVYSHTLGLKVSLDLSAPDGLIFGVIFMVTTGILSAVTAHYERRFDADVFKKRRPFGVSDRQEDEREEYESLFDTSEDDEVSSELRKEQAERIRILLNKKDEENDK